MSSESRSEAEERWPDDDRFDPSRIRLGRLAFEEGAKWAVVATPERVELLCEAMHEAYESAAAVEGWVTQKASRKPWAEVPEANKRTMRAAVTAVLAVLGGEA
jgi:hypothetical protein